MSGIVAAVTRCLGGLGGENPGGVAPKAFDRSLHKTTSRFGGYTELLADLSEAVLGSVEHPESGFDGVTGSLIERAEQIVQKLGAHALHHRLLRSGDVRSHYVAQ